jgi:hypothetical protein
MILQIKIYLKLNNSCIYLIKLLPIDTNFSKLLLFFLTSLILFYTSNMQGGNHMKNYKFVIRFLILFLLLTVTSFFTLCSSNDKKSESIVSSRSYSGHESDIDANNFVKAYPNTIGTRLDDCQTCHRAGISGTSTSKIYNPCSYCHLLEWPDSGLTDGVPTKFEDTLNSFGLAYKNAGKTKDALLSIGSQDSDGDGFINKDEIADNRFPGNSNSKPGQPIAIIKTVSESSFTYLVSAKLHEQFLLMNTSKQQFDDYATYGGVKVSDLIESLGIDLSDVNITGISVFAPDGFKKDFVKSDIIAQYPDETFYWVDQTSLASNLQFINYEQPTSSGISDGSALGNLWLMIASYRGPYKNPLSESYYDNVTGKQEGEGPYRIIPPMKNPTPGRPDRGNGQTQDSDITWNYNSSLDHNAGSSVRGMCIIRINPMPAGYEEYDTSNGWSLITDKKIVLYGYGIN